MVLKICLYQPTFNILELKKTKAPIMLLVLNQKNLFESKITWFYLPNKKYFGHKVGMQFNSTPLVVEQNNYTAKIVNAYIFCDLDNWPKIPLRNFKLKNCSCSTTNVIVRLWNSI